MTDQLQIVDDRGGLISASSVDMYYRCAGARHAQVGLEELPKEDVTESGTAIHEARASDDHEGLDLTEREIANKLKEMETRAFDSWMADFNLSYHPDLTRVVEIKREERLWIRNRATLELIASAKPDVWCINGEHAFVLDYKTGFGQTTPSELNWQSRTQVIALWQNYPDLTSIRGAILASRLSSKFDSTDYTLEDLQRIERELRTIIWRTEQSDAPRVPGQHCRYCRANGVCREKAVYDQISSAQLPVVSKGKSDQLAIIEAVDRLTPQEIGFLYRRKSSLEIAYDAMEHRMKQMPAETLESIGYKLSDGSKLKDIVDVPTAFARLGGLLTNEERMQVIKITRGKAAELLADRTNISKKEAQGQVDEAMGDAVVEREGNKRLRAL